MDNLICAMCAQDFEGPGIKRHGQVFCSAECCDDFELDMNSDVDPKLEDLVEEDLGYRNGDFDDDENLSDLEDDFDISLDDF